MSAWRRRAIELFPDLRGEFEADDFTPHRVFFELLPRCLRAHQARDEAELEKIYGYAEWCHRQKAQGVWNAVAVSFYEHLGDRPETLSDMPKWVKRDIVEDLAELFEYAMGKPKFEELKKRYQ